MPRPFSPEPATVVRGLGDPSKYLLRNERVVVAVRRHIMVLVAAFLETIGFILGALMIQALLGYVQVVRTITMLIALAAVVRFCYLILEWRLERFVITDQRMMLVGGVLTRQVAVTPMRKVTDLTFEKPPIGQILGYGTFIVESAGQDQALSRIEYLPRANRLYLMVSDLLFGDPRGVYEDDLMSDPTARRRRDAPEPKPLPDSPPGDLARTDPTLGQQLAGLDYDVSPDEFWAAQLKDFPPGGANRLGESRASEAHRREQPALFDALQEPDSASRRMRDRLGGLNGRGRRREDVAATESPNQRRRRH